MTCPLQYFKDGVFLSQRSSPFKEKNGLKDYSQRVLNTYLGVFGTFMKESQPCSVFHNDMLPLQRGIHIHSLFMTLEQKDVLRWHGFRMNFIQSTPTSAEL